MSILDRVHRAVIRTFESRTGDLIIDWILGFLCLVLTFVLVALVVTEAGRLTGIWVPSWDTPYNRGDMPEWLELVMFLGVAFMVLVRGINYLKPLPKR